MALELDQDQLDIIGKVQKLLAVAGSTTNEAEAAAFSAKAQALLEAYNLDAAAVDGDAGEGAARGEEKHKGGFYTYERDLWSAIARLNFCMHFTQQSWVKRTEADAKRAKVQAYRDEFRREYRKRHDHRVIGRKANVIGTKVMADYLLGTIDRMCSDFIKPRNLNPRSRSAQSFREGMAERLVGKLEDRRWELLQAERKKQEEAERKARENQSTPGQMLTLANIQQTESDLNNDHFLGLPPGTTAQRRAEREVARRRADEDYKAWAEAHPEEAAAQKKKQREEWDAYMKKARRGGRGSRGGTSHEKEVDWDAYHAGRAAGEAVGLDPQVRKGAAVAGFLN
jgi:hypothetical protein